MWTFFFTAFTFEEDIPEYDMDTSDGEWLENFNKKKVIKLLWCYIIQSSFFAFVGSALTL